MASNTEKSSEKLSDNTKTSIFLTPAFLVLLLFFLIPMLLTIMFSFTNLALTGTQASQLEFVGFDNFVQMFNDSTMYGSIINTLVFVIFSAVLGQCLMGFLIAFMLKGKNVRFRRIIGIAVIAAWVTPEVVVGFAWTIFLGDQGMVNNALMFIAEYLPFLPQQPIAWLFQYPMISVVIANIWRGTAFSMMAFQTALDDIPTEVEEAATMDGAKRWGLVRHITVPMVKGTIVTNLLLVTLQTLGVFTLIYTMTGGGPNQATMTLPVYMYQQAFVSYQLGYGTAISLVLLIIGAAFSLFYIKFLNVEI